MLRAFARYALPFVFTSKDFSQSAAGTAVDPCTSCYSHVVFSSWSSRLGARLRAHLRCLPGFCCERGSLVSQCRHFLQEKAVKFHVPDMSCNHCVASITKAVKELSSDAHVVCDLHDHIVEIVNLIEKTPQEVMEVLEEAGYEATLLEAQA